uniref:Uncharacterized protein n=1 Tax=viral metagenome TaxID=1070528 RepID=A0A6C0LEL1_9ZZZZ
MTNLFLDHPNSVCLTYNDHFKLSMKFSYKFDITSLKAFIHATFPFMFIKSTTEIMNDIENQLKINKCD